MLIRTLEKNLYREKVNITHDDGVVWIPLKDVKKSINSIRTSHDGKCTNKKLERILESLNIIPVKFKHSSSLYVTWTEANKIERGFIEYTMGENDNEVFNLRV